MISLFQTTLPQARRRYLPSAGLARVRGSHSPGTHADQFEVTFMQASFKRRDIMGERCTILILALLFAQLFAAAGPAAPPRAADPLDTELKGLVTSAIVQLYDDPAKRTAALHFDKPEHAQTLVPLLGKSAGGWKRLKGLIAQKRLGEVGEPAAVTFVGFPFETPGWFEYATRSGKGDQAVLGEETDGYEIKFRKVNGKWAWDLAAQLELKGGSAKLAVPCGGVRGYSPGRGTEAHQDATESRPSAR